jgi:3-methyladenine DNA glycosylase Tag
MHYMHRNIERVIMRSFEDILNEAIEKHGSLEAVEANLPSCKSTAELMEVDDSRWLSQLAKEVFVVQFSRKVLLNKWDAFERAFDGFEPGRVALYSDEDLDRLISDASIVRNGVKIRATLDNAVFIADLAHKHGSAAKFFAEWPVDDIVSLWLLMKERGSRLGGATGPRALRNMGKDTFILTPDVEKVLIEEGVIDRPAKTAKALAKVQQAFNQWHEESGRPLCEISRILAYSVG